MILKIEKFGTILVSRQLGKEALAVFSSDSKNLDKNEKIEIDFNGVEVLSPSWGDEVFTMLQKKFGSRLLIKKSKNSSVTETLNLLERVNNIKFNFINK